MQGDTPKALRTAELVEISDGPITVKKWSYLRALQIMKYLGSSWTELLQARAAMDSAKDLQQILAASLEFLGPKVLTVVKLSVDAPDRVTEETSLEDMLELFAAVLELNVTEKLVKKVKALLGKWKQMSPAEGAQPS